MFNWTVLKYKMKYGVLKSYIIILGFNPKNKDIYQFCHDNTRVSVWHGNGYYKLDMFVLAE